MRLPTVAGTIERRLLINYRVDPDAVATLLPAPFRPQLHRGFAVAGICLIRLGKMRPLGLPGGVGLGSENAAHRIAVEWDTPDGARTGVYIPRRDTDSRLTALAGGRLFPGRQHRARFTVTESDTAFSVAMISADGAASVDVRTRVADELRDSRLFDDSAAASDFFRLGSTGFSPSGEPGKYDGMELSTPSWVTEPVTVLSAQSSLFDADPRFAGGAAELDCGLLMRHIPVRWNTVPQPDAHAGAQT